MRIILPLILFSCCFSLNARYYWGFFAHQKISRTAVYSLPEPLYSFFRKNIDHVTVHAVDPDKRRYAVKGEAECHFIDIDYYVSDKDSILTTIPLRWDSAVSKYSEDTLRKHGVAPWNTYFTFIKLRKAFEERNPVKILRYSGDLGHYVGDIHVPLHTTHNYNGQYTGQYGIHGFWESRLPELFYEHYKLAPPKAVYIDQPLKQIWEAIKQSHFALDSVLGMEKRLNETVAGKYSYEERGATVVQAYSREYAAKYHEMLDGMVERRMRQSIVLTANLWYTAWIDAGQPDLSTIQSEKIIKEATILETIGDSLINVREHE